MKPMSPFVSTARTSLMVSFVLQSNATCVVRSTERRSLFTHDATINERHDANDSLLYLLQETLGAQRQRYLLVVPPAGAPAAKRI